MADARRAHRPPHTPRRLHRTPRGRARDRRDGLGRRDRPRDRRRAERARRAGRRRAGAAVPAVPDRRRCSTRCPRACAGVAVLDRTKEPGSIGEPLFLDVVAALAEAHGGRRAGGHAAGVGGRYGLSSKEFTPGHGRRRVRRARARAAAAPVHDRHRRRRLGDEPDLRRDARHRAARHGPRDLLRARLGRHRRREQEHDQDPRRRGAAARAGLLRLRLEEVGLADRLAPALRAAADPGAVPRAAARASSAATSSGCSTRSTCSAGRRPARRCCSTAAHAPDEVWDALPRPVQEQILAKRDRRSTRSTPAGSPATPGLAGRINIVLQTCFFAISGVLPRERGDRADQGRDRQDLRPPRRRGGRTQPGGGRPGARGRCTAIERARPGDLHARAAAARARARARLRPHRHRGDDGRPRRRPAGQRAAGRRHLPERHDGVREAQHLRAGRGLGLGPAASSAATAASSARTA